MGKSSVNKHTSNEYEKKYYPSLVMGIDEAGRGPIAGPLVVAGVVFPSGYQNEQIYDSKQLSEAKREKLYDIIIKDALAYQIIIVDEKTIDQLNIYQATKKTMETIARSLDATICLTDAMPLDGVDKVVEAIVKGDQKSVNIAAASILAKVTRDRLMKEYDQQYPQYGFAKHKGYPTKQHLAALEAFGPCLIHRHSYGPVYRLDQMKLDI
ncbi:MAG: ribonuclease HII [Erysipelotrichaceae bacterium]|nr:ribonuclease HII [Erysipelotrichaceae bacterium]MDY5252695.1 ribonuclease HII [Erysipelotrichaceae bacterium]